MLLNVPLKNCQWWASKWRLCLVIWAIEQEGIFVVPHLLWQGGLVFSSEGLPHSVALYDKQGIERTFSTSDNFVIWMEGVQVEEIWIRENGLEQNMKQVHVINQFTVKMNICQWYIKDLYCYAFHKMKLWKCISNLSCN